MTDLRHKDLVYRIRGVLFDVHNHLGNIYSEKTYENAIVVGLEYMGISAKPQEVFTVQYKGHEVGMYVPDILVDEKVILELKNVPSLLPIHKAQVISYLKVTGKGLGLLANFGEERMNIQGIPNLLSSKPVASRKDPPCLDHTDMLYPKLLYAIVGALFEVHTHLGPGFFHHGYRRSTMIELSSKDLP